MSAGSYFILRKGRQGKVGEFHEEWYLRLRFPGKPERMINSGYDICPKCMACPDAEALRMRAACGCRTQPKRAAKLQLEGMNDERMIGAMEAARMRRVVATVGQIIAAYLDDGVRILKSQKQARRNANDLRRVLAFARDLWTTHQGGVRGVKIGAQIADARRIDALSATVLNAATVEAYYRAATGGTLDWNEPQEGNGSVNSTLAHAQDVFSRNARYHKLKGLTLPDCVQEFCDAPPLPEEDAAPDPLTAADWAAMMAAQRALRGQDAELRVVNLLLRQTALRSSYVEALRADWMTRDGDGWGIEVRDRPAQGWRKKRGTRDQRIPLSPLLARLLLRRAAAAGPTGYLVLPHGSDRERHELVHRRHNAWLKGIVGGTGERTQGNHRLRDTVASVLWSIDRPTAAQEALGHASVDVTAKHYGRKIYVSEAMRSELAAWGR